jgi:small conductance mechanosensitive channel
VSGAVETMTLRRTQVRGGDGTLFIIPNSQITTVANMTRDYSLATINVSVDFSANPDEVMKLLKEVAMGVREDPAYKDVFLADPILLGVDAIRGSQVIYPVQFKTKANQQWAAQREMQRRIQIALDQHGILPGDPNRVYSADGAQPSSTGTQEANGAGGQAEGAAPKPDPTTIKPAESNPFTGGQ